MYKQILPIILASKSPRRQDLMRSMDLNFQVVLKDVDESYPENLLPSEIAVYVAEKKAAALAGHYTDHILITADTIVAHNNEILGKPADKMDAINMLQKLSGATHQVFTGVSLSYKEKTLSFYDMTKVLFRPLSNDQIGYYVEQYNPLDKAGAYGIQDWIGMVAIERIEGSYTNVMGLPTEKLYQALIAI